MKYKKHLWLIALILGIIYLGSNPRSSYIFYRRISRLIAISLVAYLVNLNTTLFQALSQNRILSPSLLGFDRLYLLIQICLIFIIGTVATHPFVTLFIMSSVSMILYPSLLRRCRHDIFLLLLIGTVMSTLFGSITTALQMMMDPNEFSLLQNQSFASFNQVHTEYLGITLLLTFGITLAYRKVHHQIDVLILGDDTALSLGVNVNHLQKHILFLVILSTSLVTTLVGPITFLGLLTTNIAREVNQTSKTHLLIYGGSLYAFILLMSSQLFFERIFNFTTSISVFINLFGSITLITLMFKERSHD